MSALVGFTSAGALARRTLVAATLIGALLVAAAPVSAARTFSFSACWDGDSVVASLSWSGIRVDNYAFGAGQLDGFGLGFTEPIDTATSGAYSNDWGATVDDTFDLVGGDIYFHNLRRAIKSDQVLRPLGGWADLDPCSV